MNSLPDDAIERLPDRFGLVILAARRARSLLAGAPTTLDAGIDAGGSEDRRQGAGMAVLAMNEIAAGTVQPDDLREALVRDMQRYTDQYDTITLTEKQALRAFVEGE